MGFLLRWFLKKLFKEIDWTKYASLATNSCYHLGKSHIFQALYDHLDSLKDN
ncbi:type II restriction endonuclease [Helicobacter pylori]|nr:type II restriction endonuclease [Helicobacter pylori]